MKVLLINPPIFRISEPWYDTPPFVRPGLAYIAGYLRQFPEFDIKIIDPARYANPGLTNGGVSYHGSLILKIGGFIKRTFIFYHFFYNILLFVYLS